LGEKALCARETLQRPGMTSTGRCACTTTADDTLPRNADWTRDRPRAPTTIGSASRLSASSQIARQLLPSATLPRTSNPAARARATPRSDVSRAIWPAISSRPSSFEASFDTRAVRIVAGSYGAHSATGSHTVSTTAVRGPSSSPAFAIAAAASFDPSKHKSTGCGSFALVLGHRSIIPYRIPAHGADASKRLRKHSHRTACPSVTVPGGRRTKAGTSLPGQRGHDPGRATAARVLDRHRPPVSTAAPRAPRARTPLPGRERIGAWHRRGRETVQRAGRRRHHAARVVRRCGGPRTGWAAGIQALRNFADVNEFTSEVCAPPDYITTLATSAGGRRRHGRLRAARLPDRRRPVARAAHSAAGGP
jgi:hypothetical protein